MRRTVAASCGVGQEKGLVSGEPRITPVTGLLRRPTLPEAKGVSPSRKALATDYTLTGAARERGSEVSAQGCLHSSGIRVPEAASAW